MHGYILPAVSDKPRVSLNLLTQQVFHVVVPLTSILSLHARFKETPDWCRGGRGEERD